MMIMNMNVNVNVNIRFSLTVSNRVMDGENKGSAGSRQCVLFRVCFIKAYILCIYSMKEEKERIE